VISMTSQPRFLGRIRPSVSTSPGDERKLGRRRLRHDDEQGAPRHSVMRLRRSHVLLTVAGTAAATVLLAAQGPLAGASDSRAEATLRLADGSRVGVVHFSRGHHGLTTVTLWLRLPAGAPGLDDFHGFHVHANSDPANGSGCVADPAAAASTWFVSADGHYTDSGKTHGAHDGDLSSVLVSSTGRAYAKFTTSRLVPSELVGKAIILHAGRDNFGNVPLGTAQDQYTANSPTATAKTLATGNSGDRIACGVVRH
jgi:superoxide dismutase, Cu-Zn family